MSEAPPPTAEHARRDLDRRLVSGVAWTAAARWTSQAVSWAALYILTRLLSPSDFGLVGMAGLFITAMAMLSEFGIDTAVIASPHLTDTKIRQINTVSAMLGAAGAIIAVAAAAPLAAFFRAPELKAVVPVMGLAFAINGFRIVPQSLLLKEFKFKVVSGLETTQGLTQSAVAIGLAFLGFRYWAIILGNLASALVMSVLAMALRPTGFSRPRAREIKNEVAFSGKVLTMRAAWNIYSNSDFLAAGRCLGKDALGKYTLAWNIANVPLDRVTTLILRVTPSIFSKVQHDAAELKRYLRIFVEGIALVTFPLSFGLALVAHALMGTVFDIRWQEAATPLRILALTVGLRSLGAVMQQVLNFVNDVTFSMWQSIATAAILVPAFFYASRWGSAGIAMVWLAVACPFLLGTIFVRAGRKTGLGIAEFMRAISPALLASGAMVLVVLAEDYLMAGQRLWTKLIAESLTGGAVYSGLLLMFHRSRLAALYQAIFRKETSAAA